MAEICRDGNEVSLLFQYCFLFVFVLKCVELVILFHIRRPVFC